MMWIRDQESGIRNRKNWDLGTGCKKLGTGKNIPGSGTLFETYFCVVGPDPTLCFSDCQDAKIFFYFIFSYNLHYLQSWKFNFVIKFCVKFFLLSIISVRSTPLWQKGMIRIRYLWLMDPDPGGPTLAVNTNRKWLLHLGQEGVEDVSVLGGDPLENGRNRIRTSSIGIREAQHWR